MSYLARITVQYGLFIFILLLMACAHDAAAAPPAIDYEEAAGKIATLNQKDDGYRGIWYAVGRSDDEYGYKYSGGLGTYCAKHRPFSVYCPEVEKTFFCYGGAPKDTSRELLHMVSYYDHKTKKVPRPTLLLDKQTDNAHDNPTIAVDHEGYIWIFSTSHGLDRPSFIHRSTEPYSVDEFERINATYLEDGQAVPLNNFSYTQFWPRPEGGFNAFFSRYFNPAPRTLMFMSSDDGHQWSHWQTLAAIDEGHYQITEGNGLHAASAFNYHPRGKGLDYRTNLYYIETKDGGKTWQNIHGKKLSLPITDVDSDALVRDYQSEGLIVYIKDVHFDEEDRPVILMVTSLGYQSGPANDPRTWTVARWTGGEWKYSDITTSDNNYDTGSIYLEGDQWRVIGPTETGPQAYNPGGEMCMWISRDRGETWELEMQLTHGSEWNHTYARRTVNAHPDFYAFWADGHGRQPSESRLYFANQRGEVFQLPVAMKSDFEKPLKVSPPDGKVSALGGVRQQQ